MGDDRVVPEVHGLLLHAALIRALALLRDAGVPVIVLKGAALASTIYPSLADRPMADVDLLVHPEDRDRARAALERGGYRFVPEPAARFNPFNTEFTGEMSFLRNKRDLVELHWELTPSDWLRRLVRLDMAQLWRDAVPFRAGKAEALQLSPCDTLLHLCLHLAAHGFVHGNGFRDIRQLVDHAGPFPWDRFVARARRFQMASQCYFVLDAVAGLGERGIPAEVLAALRPPALQRWAVRRIANPRRGAASRLEYSRPAGYLLHLALADRPSDAMRVVVWLFFPGPRWLAERYRLRGRPASYAACLWHPVFVMSQGLSGLWAVCRTHA